MSVDTDGFPTRILSPEEWREHVEVSYQGVTVEQLKDWQNSVKAHERMVEKQVEAKERKQYPVASGVIDYFPLALKAVAYVSFVGNEQHNPGTPLHWDRNKSGDEADALMRHFLERGTLDSDGIPHSAKVAWRALALLQKELESGA
jgi:hypothetical protein